tara:strand:- start:33 stop:347 length:315 start_codon:yes stop_codon:yes gene_type:complete
MIFRVFKIFFIINIFLFTTGFIPIMGLVGPATTIISSGNIYKASAQFIIDQTIKKKTGKHSLTLVKDEIEKKEAEKNLQKELRLLVEKRIKLTRQKLDLKKVSQ